MIEMYAKRDSHIHTQFCPHGSRDHMETYVNQAIKIGLKEISFTEHAPLPESFIDPAPTRDSSMKLEDVPAYFQEGEYLKAKYQGEIKINLGFEVDYLDEFKEETINFLNKWGEKIDDAILSVHMIPVGREYICMDYSPDEFGRIVSSLGSIERVHGLYYQLIEKSIQADLGKYKPKRIGHLTLVNKFQKKFPASIDSSDTIMNLLKQIRENDLELDANTAGWYKPDCGESYPPVAFIKHAASMGITIVPGSDSHQAGDLTRGFEKLVY